MNTPKQPRKYPYNHDTSFLPQSIQRDLDIIKEAILSEFDSKIAMIWLFGSYARNEAINDRRIEPETGKVSEYYSDIDILAISYGRNIAERTRRWEGLRLHLEDHPEISRQVHLINDYEKRVNEALKNDEYFYADIVKEGIVLHNPYCRILSRPSQISPTQRRKYAIHYHNKFYQRADASRRTIMLHYQLGDLASCMHNLHQMTERLYYGYLLVLTHYKPRTHNLKELRHRVAKLNPHIQTLFPLTTKEQETQHQFLIKAYVDARYSLHYHVEQEQVDFYIEQIGAFQAWVLDESLQYIDGLIPEESYSTDYNAPGEIMTLEVVQQQQLPQAVIEEQLQALKAAEQKLAESEATLEKEQAEKEKLLQKLRDAGIEP